MRLESKTYVFEDAPAELQLLHLADELDERAEVCDDSQIVELAQLVRHVSAAIMQGPSAGLYTLTLRNRGAGRWRWRVTNPVGGSDTGLALAGRQSALDEAQRLIPPGARYVVVTDGEPGREMIREGSL